MKQGFSLVELSIVLVILGLLVGGVLSGRSLIHTAELRSVSTDFANYKSAINSFQDKYSLLPGDMPNATTYWGKDASICNTAVGNAGMPGTCNGDGGGSVDGNERYLFWQHLALAGLIEGTYAGNSSATFNPGTTVPKSRISGGYYVTLPMDETMAVEQQPAGLDRASIFAPVVLGADGVNSSGTTIHGSGGVLTNEDAWNLDTKMDDGKADNGLVRGDIIDVSTGIPVPGTCLNYVLTNTTDHCMLFYQLK